MSIVLKKTTFCPNPSPKPYPLFIPCSTSFSSSHPSSSHFHICLQSLLHHQPAVPPPPPPPPLSEKPTGIPIPVSCFIPAPASMLHPAELNGVCRRQASRVCSVQFSSAQLGCQRYKLTVWLLSERDSSTQEGCADGYYVTGYSQPWRVGWERKGGVETGLEKNDEEKEEKYCWDGEK